MTGDRPAEASPPADPHLRAMYERGREFAQKRDESVYAALLAKPLAGEGETWVEAVFRAAFPVPEGVGTLAIGLLGDQLTVATADGRVLFQVAVRELGMVA